MFRAEWPHLTVCWKVHHHREGWDVIISAVFQSLLEGVHSVALGCTVHGKSDWNKNDVKFTYLTDLLEVGGTVRLLVLENYRNCQTQPTPPISNDREEWGGCGFCFLFFFNKRWQWIIFLFPVIIVWSLKASTLS